MIARRASLGLLAPTAALAACVLVEPPGDLPVTPPHRPIIEHPGVVPATTQVLEQWPLEFVVPIEVFDPSASVKWHALLDYDPSGAGQLLALGQVDPDPASQPGGVRLLPVRVSSLPTDGCHTLAIVVALNFEDAHTPDATGGDTVTWLYAPNGSLTSCSIFDAGAVPLTDAGDAAPADGAAE